MNEWGRGGCGRWRVESRRVPRGGRWFGMMVALVLILAGCGGGSETRPAPARPGVGRTPTVSGRPVPTSRAVPQQPARGTAGLPTGIQAATVDDVVDGDTIEIRFAGDGTVYDVRLIGIDTPETKHPTIPPECFGAEASARTEALLPPGTAIFLEKDVSETDRFGRLLRYVWLSGGRGRPAVNANEVLVREGFATASTFPPDVKYADRFTAAQRLAYEEGAGLWSACRGEVPTPRGQNQSGLFQDRDCGDFASQREAQTLLDDDRSDPHQFDPDGDGRACEGLPTG